MYQPTPPPYGRYPEGPHRRGPEIYIIGVIAGVLVVGAVIAVVIALMQRSPAAPAAASSPVANPQPTVAQTQQAPSKTIVIEPPSSSGDTGTADAYVQDIWNAGIVAPASWVESTGQQLCSAWDAGATTADTDQQLLAGGIYSYHLQSFDSITESDLCPGALR